MCKNDRQKIKDYLKEYRKNITNEQKHIYIKIIENNVEKM